jgi:hypothetical protein
MKINILILITIAVLYGCSSFHYSSKNIIGVYTQITNDSLKSFINLTIGKTEFNLVDVRDYTKLPDGGSQYLCCDTIAYGTWEIDNKHGVLSLSTSQLTNGYLKSKVIEQIDPRHTDSVYFVISNPIEKNMGTKHTYVFYTIEMDASGDFGNLLYDKEFRTSKIAVPNSFYDSINSISINAYTTPDYFARNISVNPVKTIPYILKNKRSNVFYIDIPKLTFGYITYLRLHEHLIKIVNKNELVWDGVIYRRK